MLEEDVLFWGGRVAKEGIVEVAVVELCGYVDASGAQQGAGRLYGGDEIVDCTVHGLNAFGQF